MPLLRNLYSTVVTFKESLRREKYVIIHGQTTRFRIVKYLVLFTLGIGLFFWKGWMAVGLAFACLFILGLAVHFLFRWKTKAWTESWGPYKKLDLPK